MSRLEGLLNFLEKEPNDSFTLYAIALEYLSLNKFSEAEEYLNRLLVIDPNYVPAYMQFARLKEARDDLEAAKEFYRKGIFIAKETGDKKAAKEMEDFLDDLE